MNNQAFWNERYLKSPELGSGPGSRGGAAIAKQHLIAGILRNNAVGSVLDIGCGDLCWYEEGVLGTVVYTGLDISDVLIERNARRWPYLKFVRHDISLEPLGGIAADLVLCFDVLLHQTQRSQLENALKTVLHATARHALISYPAMAQDDKLIERAYHPTPEMVASDEQLKKLLAQFAQTKKRRNSVRLFDGFCDMVRQFAPDIRMRRLAEYRRHPMQDGRMHTVYELTRVGHWLQF